MIVLREEDRLQFNEEKKEELKATLRMISNWMVLPLYFLFWICDIIYYPEQKWLFLAIRSAVIPTCFLVQYFGKKAQTLRQHEILGLVFITVLANDVNAMIYVIGNVDTRYYAGLCLVAIGSLTFIPWSRLFFIFANFAIFAPYYALGLTNIAYGGDYKPLFVHSFFIIGTIVITLVIRVFHNRLRILEFKSRLKLNEEIGNRDQIIIEKTDEGLRLAALSRQFSPQIVQAIRKKKLDLNNDVHRAKICAVFIDIVNSTERVARMDKDKIHSVISAFTDDTMKVLLKYDITIDKFLGDGILAFSNDPVKYNDFVVRVLYAAFEVKNVIQSKVDFYEKNWLSPLELKIGVAVGFANVGFYGSEKFFKTYTAIGPVVNLASRLCAVAAPNTVVVDADVLEHIDKDEFIIKPVGKLKLKGFESDTIKGFMLEATSKAMPLSGMGGDCDECRSGLLQLASDAKGIYILKCNFCGHIKTTHDNPKINAA